MNIKAPWVIDKKLTHKEREILFITLLSAGFVIYPDTREHTDVDKFPYIAFNDHNKITGTAAINAISYEREIVKYEDVMEALKVEIKNRKV